MLFFYDPGGQDSCRVLMHMIYLDYAWGCNELVTWLELDDYLVLSICLAADAGCEPWFPFMIPLPLEA